MAALPGIRSRLSALRSSPLTRLLGLLVVLVLALRPIPAGAANGGSGLTPAPVRRHHRVHRAVAHHRHRAPRRASHHPRGHALGGRAMWIWELGDSDGGSPAEIVAAARRFGITTVLVKSSDGTEPWSQFSPALVRELHAGGLRVCAWQYVYGNFPGVEANLGAAAVRAGADCLVIDAESEYEGKYVAAQSYVRDLRKQIGAAYPLALAGFPYVDYHPAFPYSVFLGPGGAQTDAPQMYWRDIGTSVDGVFAHTYAFNLPYGRRIDPLGQIYADPPTRQIARFRELDRAYRAPGVSWWDWQEATPRMWEAISRPLGRTAPIVPDRTPATLGRGASGDLVVWAQEHLVAAGFPSPIDGIYGAAMARTVAALQRADGILADGLIGPETWRELQRRAPVRVTWTHRGRRTVATDALRADALRSGGTGTAAGAPLALPAPRSATRPARRDEIPGSLGAG